jgi:Na+-translocating ferredoxin:NAD+ oxidoreductase RnfG subunit
MKKVWILILVSGSLLSLDLPKNGLKKLNKAITQLWPEKEIVRQPIKLSASSKAGLSTNFENDRLFKLKCNEKFLSYMYLAQAKSKISNFDYVIFYRSDLSILKVKMLVYREEYGGEIGSNRWLGQFEGKSSPEKMKFGHDIQNISGATISARSLTFDVKKVTENLIMLKEKGYLN